MLTFEQIKELIDIVCQKGLQGLEVERSDFRLRIDGQATRAAQLPAGNVMAASGSEPTAVAESDEVPNGSGESTPGGEDDHTITSPIVGTFYAAPSPDAEPYVQEGDEVEAGQVLCIVEAMKLMNEIESDVDGVVVSILGRNSQPVEFGEPLFTIRPA